ncbi:RNA polymerase sigma-70 factor [Compostibacter hankyongensis]|uniref:RNA polymerase sigma-70 factor n=1 Tax=Compostibacter hankyongensis TaxID=1007089 RepID=A0ABP8FK43_9BACT
MNNPLDEILMSRLKEGDEEAFRDIYERYWERLYKLGYYYTGSREESEDIVMDVYLSLWNNRYKVTVERLDAYLVKAVKNNALKCLIRRQRQRGQLNMPDHSGRFPVIETDSPEYCLEVKELALQLHHDVQSLPEKTKRIFLLHREDGLTYEKIAARLSVSVKTVEYHISKAIRTLNKYTLLLAVSLLYLPLH